MRKIFIITCLMLVSVCTFAQKGEKAIGVNVNYGSESLNIGFGLKGQYNITDVIRTEASFDYFLEKDYGKNWDINLNLHYLFNVSEKCKVYPLAGLTYTTWSFDFNGMFDDWEDDWEDWSWEDDEDEDSGSVSESNIGLNLGGGLLYDLNDRISLNLEVKYSLASLYSQLVVGVGAVYKF